MPKLDDLHEWMSFSDPDKDQTWIVDATFMLSNWTCIWGRGCKGVLDDDATKLQQGCCSFGAHFVDEDDVKTVKRSSKRLTSKHWQFKSFAAKSGWSTTDKNGTVQTRVVDGACIFLNRPGFAGGDVPQIPANLLLVKNLSVIGLYWGGYLAFRPGVPAASMATLFGWFGDGILRPHISNVLPFDRAAEGLDLLRGRKATGKVVVTLP